MKMRLPLIKRAENAETTVVPPFPVMVPAGYVPTTEQAEAIIAFRPRLRAARSSGLYAQAVLAREFMEALHDNGFVVADDFLPWVHAWQNLSHALDQVGELDLPSIQLTLTFEALFDFDIGGRFVEFAYSPVADALLRRLAALYDLPEEPADAAAPAAPASAWIPRQRA